MIASDSLKLLYDYADAVEGGDVVVGHYIEAAVARFRRDMERQNTEEFPYYFDAGRATATLDFFPLCLRHSIGRFEGDPFHLEPWQAFGIGNAFGWMRCKDHTRRFRNVYWSQGRKNGKSTTGSGIALFLAGLDVNPLKNRPEAQASVILCATKRDQVQDVMFAELQRMRVASEHIASRSNDINKKVTFDHNGGEVKCIGSDKPYSGLNPHSVIKDELHEWRKHHRTFYDTMMTGGASRDQPINWTFTTSGDDKAYIWLEEFNHAKGVLDEQYSDETLFAYLFMIDDEDDPCDEKNWPKANPNLHTSVSLDYLREQPKETRYQINRFDRYHCNRLVSSTESAFDMPTWDRCKGVLSNWDDADAFGIGVDLGGRDDLAAYSVVARFIEDWTEPSDPDEESVPIFRYEVRAFSYIASDTERDLEAAPWAQWIDEGKIVKCRYPITMMKGDIIDAANRWYAEDVAYDPAGAQQFAEELEQEGLLPARMPQTYTMFNEPISDMTQAMADGRLRHDGDPVLRWAISNAVACQDRQNRWMLDKSESGDKIDPAVALVMAYRRAMVASGRATDDNLIVV